MLGFILSKMQMLFFAVGIAVVALMFLNFVSVIGLQRTADAVLASDLKVVSDQSTADLLCSFKQTAIPDKLVYGVSNTPYFYDLEFIKEKLVDSADASSPTNVLIMRIVEHQISKAGAVVDPTKIDESKKKVVSAKSFVSESEFILIDPAFLTDLSPLTPVTYNVPFISLYPRAASPQSTAASPNGFVALKEVVNGKRFIYIIPCASEKEENNCLNNIFRVGCYKLKTEHANDLKQDTLIDSCFNIILPTAGVSETEKTKNFTWKDCLNKFPAIGN